VLRNILKISRWLVPAGLVVIAVTAGTASASNPLEDVRVATAKYHSTVAANHDGYIDPGLPCFDDPAHGAGMGTHLVNFDLVDGTLDRTHPEALVYEVRDGSVKLVAVEYLMPKSLSTTAPVFLGQTMIANDDLGLWTLHAWIWRDNPLNLFETYNSNVSLCPRG
jgi:hypothetical protein